MNIQQFLETIHIQDLLPVSFALFAVIDPIGSIPLFLSYKEKTGFLDAKKITIISGFLMISFLFIGESFLSLLGVDVKSFAIAGSIVIFLLGLEMVLGHEIFKTGSNPNVGIVVPIAFPLIAGSSTLTTIISLKALHGKEVIIVGIIINLIIVFLILSSLKFLQKLLGPSGIAAIHKFFGVILLAIAVKIFGANIEVFVSAFSAK